MPKADSPLTTSTASLAVPSKSQVKSSSDLSTALAEVKRRFVGRNLISGKLFEEAAGYLPGGNTRTLLYSAPYPVCMKKGEHYQVFDEDGHT